MSLFKKFFGGGDPLAAVRRACSQGRWAEALAAGEGIGPAVDAAQAAELEALLLDAGEQLASWNLQEGRAYLESGDLSRAAEHFALAKTHARSVNLRAEAEAALSGARTPQPPVAAPVTPVEPMIDRGCASGCCSGAPKEAAAIDFAADLDPEARLELLLAGFPPHLAERYAAASPRFKEAFLFSHEGATAEALACLDDVEASARDDLYYFERGSLLARSGEADAAFADLEQSVAVNPDLELAWEAWIDLKLAAGLEDQARQRLAAMLADGTAVAFCHARLAALEMQDGSSESALHHGLSALQQGDSSPATVSLCATLLERVGRDAEAEQLLSGLGGGCCGGVNVQLAEFWLRRSRHLDKVLETFKGALREDPANSRWPFRIAQVYLARGWSREGIPLLEKALADPRLDDALRGEGVTLLDTVRGI